jgi:rubrerythrin
MKKLVDYINEDASTSLDVKIDKLDNSSLERVIRQAIIAEYDAANMYLKAADAIIGNKEIKKIFIDIANEEKVHIGEFMEALKKLNPEEAKFYEQGIKEASRKMK